MVSSIIWDPSILETVQRRSRRVAGERVDLLDIAAAEGHWLLRRCQSEPRPNSPGQLFHFYRDHVFVLIMDDIVPGDGSFYRIQVPHKSTVPRPVGPLDEACSVSGTLPPARSEPENSQLV